VDPLGIQIDQNPYRGIANNPVGWVDPQGLEKRDLWKPVALFWLVNPELFWSTVIKGLEKKGWRVSALLLEHSLLKNAPDLQFADGSLVGEAIRGSREYQSRLAAVAKRLCTKSETSGSLGIEWKTGDLFGALHFADFSYETDDSMLERGAIIYNIVVKIHDRYDFKWESDYGPTLFGQLTMTGNNLAVIDQLLGRISNFNIDVALRQRISCACNGSIDITIPPK